MIYKNKKINGFFPKRNVTVATTKRNNEDFSESVDA